MRFRQPDFYAAEATHDMPRWAAVREMLRRGLLRRGIRPEEAEFLLGEPYNATSDVPIQQMEQWLYSNGLILRFANDHRLSECLQAHDGEPNDARTDDLFARTP